MYAKMKPILCQVLTLLLVASFTTNSIASSRRSLSHEERRILAYSRQHYVNRLRDPSSKVEYHDGKDERGEVLQKPKQNMSHIPSIEVEATLLKKRCFHAARRAIEAAIIQKGDFRKQMSDGVQAAKEVLEETRSQPIVRRLTEHYKRTGRRLSPFIGTTKQTDLPLETAEFIRFEISTQRLRYTSKGRHLLQNQNDFDICNAHNLGREWLREMCVDIQLSEWEEREGQRLGGRNLCQECSAPNQLCYQQASCNDKMLKCPQLTSAEKEQLKSEFQAVKAKSPALSLEDHPCLLDYCPALRNEVARNSKCGEAVYQWCCDPDSPDCPLTERTSCTATGCSTILNEDVDMHWLIEQIMIAEGIAFEDEEAKWAYFEKKFEEKFQCPFSKTDICEDPASPEGRYCAMQEMNHHGEGEPFEVHPFWRDLSEVPRLANSLNKPCWHGYCFNQAVLDSCPLTERPDFRPADGAPTAGQVFEMMFTGQSPMDKVSVDNMQENAPGCKIGCKPLLDFIMKVASEPKASVKPSDIDFPEAVNNTVSVCESTFRKAMGMGGGKRRLNEQEGDGEGADGEGGDGEGGDGEGEGGEGEGGEGGEQPMGDTSWEFRQCLYSQCAACFPMGDDGRSKTTQMKTNDIEYILFTGNGVDGNREQCAYDVAEYCKTDGLNDPSCAGATCEKRLKANSTLCSTVPHLKSYFSLPLCDKVSCLDYQNELITLYGKRGYYQPGDSWQEGLLRFQNALLYPRNQKPSIDFTLSPEDVSIVSKSKALCSKPEAVSAYVETIVKYCNTAGRGHDAICREFSKCGDGIVTWGESCDPGPGSDPTFDGCQRCEHIKDGFACAKPGLPCGRCDLDENILRQTALADSACPFCLNNKLKGTSRDLKTSPCDYTKCKDIRKLEDAKACDDFVHQYCENLNYLGMSDPGCVSYTAQVLKFAVPRVSSNCTYKLHDIDLGSQYVEEDGDNRGGGLLKETIAIIDCEFIDETGKNIDNTPVFQHISLLKPPLKEMFEPPTDAAVVALLEEHEQTYGTGGMVPLTDLKLDHFYEYQNVNLNKEKRPLRQFAMERAPWFAMLAVENPNHNWNLEEPDPTNYDHSERENKKKPCKMSSTDSWHYYNPINHHNPEGLSITPLPPCEDATMWAIKAKALEYKFRGLHREWISEKKDYGVESDRRGSATGNMGLNQDEMYRPLRALDPNKFDPKCIPRKNHFVGMVSVSRTVDSRLCWGDDCPGQSRGRNAVAQTAVFHSFIPKPTAQRHCDYHCCMECYNNDGTKKNGCNGRCDGNGLGGPNGCCAAMHANPPVRVEDALKNGLAKMVFGNRLYQKGCVDGDCDFGVAHCSRENLSPALLAPNVTSLDTAAATLMEKVEALNKDVNSFMNLTQAQFEVTAAAAAQGYSDTKALFDKMVTTTTITETIQGVEEYCQYDWWNETIQGQSIAWKNDPCCNWDLRRTQCCKPQDIQGAQVSVIGDIDMDIVRSSCRSPTKVQGVLKDLSENIRSAGKCAADLDSEVGEAAFEKLWEFRDSCEKRIGLHGVDDMDGNGVCNTDADCFCTYSTCSSEKKCIPAIDKMGECFAQCFEIESDARLVRFLKLEWNISATDPVSKFEEKFVERMTEETCMGDDRWREGIGHNRMEWRCNATCQKSNLCHQHSIFEAYSTACRENCERQGGHNCWMLCEPWGSKDVCESSELRNFMPNLETKFISHGEGGGGHCEASGIQTPCGCDHCYKRCSEKNACEATSNDGGGTFFYESTGNPWGQCCPNGKHVHERTSKDGNGNDVVFRECKHMKKGSPEGHSVRNEACCRSFGGEWNGGHSHCCFGELKTECNWKGECETHCAHHVDTWKVCETCRKQSCSHEECKICENKRDGCCGETLILANKTACLSYKKCNDRHLDWLQREDANPWSNLHNDTPYKSVRNSAPCGTFTNADANKQSTIIYDNMGKCMECWGTHCESRTQPLKCVIETIDGVYATKQTCEQNSRTWLVHDGCTHGGCHGECRDLAPSVVNATACFQRNMAFNQVFTPANVSLAATNATKIPDWRKHTVKRRSRDGEFHRPKFYYGEAWSSKGCYLASSNPANRECPNGWWFDDELGSCRSHQNPCPVFSVDVKNRVRYESPKYTTEEECNLGRCSGGYGELAYMGLWTKEDCQTYSKQFCDRQCPKCIALGKYSQNGVTITYNSTGSTTYPSNGNGVDHVHENEEFRGKGNGACFDSSNNLVTDRRYTNGPDECMSGNEGTSFTWYSCEDQPWNSSCATSLPSNIQNILRCKPGGEDGWHRETCNTQELCSAQGECHGDGAWDYGVAMGCSDGQWEFGASHWGRKFETYTFTTKTGDVETTHTATREVHKHCTTTKWSDAGVCVDTLHDMASCPEWRRHAKGCRVDAPWIYVDGREQQNSTHCTAILGKQWFTRLETKAECEAVKGCKEKYQWGYTPKSQQDCSECSGSWEARYYWNGGVWSGGTTKAFVWEAGGTKVGPSNIWTNSFSERKMKLELQKPLMKMFAETKKSQTLLKLNSYLAGLRTIACDCGVENFGDACWDTTNSSSVVSVGTSFCGNEANVMQGGCSKVQVQQSCATSRRRRLLAASNDATGLSFGHVSAGIYAKSICTESGNEVACTCTSDQASSKIETMGPNIQNTNGVTIGQIVGDGTEFTASGTFPDSIEKCLKFRVDINARRTLFNTTDIAKLNADGTFETLNFGDFGACSGDCVSIALQKICFKARSAGTYFPILRRHMEKSTDTNACSIASFKASNGICLSGTNEKFCFCGFYGQKCDKGCPNSCSESSVVNSRCNANTHSCVCPSTHTGLDCALLNCPTDSSNNVCFNHGTCKLINNEAKCECNPLYTGDDCSTTTILEKEADNGYPIAKGLSGIEGMAFQFGWHFPSVLVAIIIWLLILTPCCQVACCFYCPCCCRKKRCCCWAEKWGCGKNKSICACRCCHTHCEQHAVRLANHAELAKHVYFTKFDKNHDGLLDAEELKQMFWKRFGAITTIEQVSLLISKFDSDSDGKLTEEEYQTMLQSLEDADTKHTTKMLRKILENLPDGTGNEKGVELVQVKPAQREMI